MLFLPLDLDGHKTHKTSARESLESQDGTGSRANTARYYSTQIQNTKLFKVSLEYAGALVKITGAAQFIKNLRIIVNKAHHTD